MTSRWIGTDEAGYGPNLGPLLVSVTSWRVPGVAGEFDLYRALQSAVSRESSHRGSVLHIADSKQVYSPARGMASLETSALALLSQVHDAPRDYWQLIEQLTGRDLRTVAGEPWLRTGQLNLPVEARREDVQRISEQLRIACQNAGVSIESLASDVVETPRFNLECEAAGSKGVVLTRTTLSLLERNWPQDQIPSLVICDKHGGRNQYAAALTEAFDELFIPKVRESAELSAYRIRGGEVRFQVRAEEHLPTAAASILSKYVRELSMMLFNQFWQAHLPALSPTKGYPEDARRFRKDVEAVRVKLAIPESVFWRNR